MLLGLTGQYFTNISLSNSPYLVRNDPVINFNWRNGSPFPGIPRDNFSVRWSGYVTPDYTQMYTFYVKTDDGVRVWVNNKLLINQWNDHSAHEYKASIQLSKSEKYPVKIEYYEHFGQAVSQFRWSSPSTPKQIIPQSHLTAY